MDEEGIVALRERLERVDSLRQEGRMADAISALEAAVEECTQRHGLDDPRTLSVRNSLVSCWVTDGANPGRLEEAARLVSDCKRVLGEDDPTTLGAREYLASLTAVCGHYEEALAIADDAVADMQRILGEAHPHTLRAQKNRAATLLMLGRANEATDELDAVVGALERAPDADRQSALATRRLLALAHRAAGKPSEAKAVLEQLLPDCERALGRDAPLTCEVRALLEDLSAYPGPYVAASGTSPRPWVYVADGRRSPAERFGIPHGLDVRPSRSMPAASALESPSEVSDDFEATDSEAPDFAHAQDGAPASEAYGIAASEETEGDAGSEEVARGVEVRVIGPFEVHGWRRPDERELSLAALLTYLVFHRDQPVRGPALRVALRPDVDGDISETTLHTYVYLLRRALGRDLFPPATRTGYQLSEKVTSDWERFGALVADGADDRDLEAALRLVRGRPFAGVPEGPFAWVDAELVLSSIETAVADAARRFAEMSKAAGDTERAAWAVRQGLLCSPYDFGLWGLHLSLAALRGQGALARARKEAEAALGVDARSLWQ